MNKIANGFWDYLERWQAAFPQERKMLWKDTYIENDYCAGCRYCCGPQDSDSIFRMALLPRQVGPETAEDFFMLDENTAGLGKDGCKSDTDFGCRLPREKRPLACGFFPIVLINGKLYLYQKCPAVINTPLRRFCELARQIAAMLMNFNIEELRHLSNEDTALNLSEDYIDLRVRLFDDSGKNLIFE